MVRKSFCLPIPEGVPDVNFKGRYLYPLYFNIVLVFVTCLPRVVRRQGLEILKALSLNIYTHTHAYWAQFQSTIFIFSSEVLEKWKKTKKVREPQ